ncbi:MAG: hypothetical protein HOP22_07400 [Nitrospiraceae bacterium]|nr:hypothetical protein [Nitrospiraceae bacterium]
MSVSISVVRAWVITLVASVAVGGGISAEAEEGQFGTPKGGEGTRIFKATEHQFYSGEFHLKGERAILIGSMQDAPPWDHLDYAGKHLNSVKGTITIDVNELTNTGQVVAEFIEGSDRYRIVFDRFIAKAPFQDGGVATRIYEHGDSGNGDPLYPKTWLYLGAWGTATMWKNNQVLYKDYDAHFMVMERSRDSKTHEVHYPVKRMLSGGETDPAAMEIDLWVRSKEQNTNNFPPFETFVHLCWEEVTWR